MKRYYQFTEQKSFSFHKNNLTKYENNENE